MFVIREAAAQIAHYPRKRVKLHGSVPLEEDIVPELASDEEDGGEEEEGADGAAAEGPAE